MMPRALRLGDARHVSHYLKKYAPRYLKKLVPGVFLRELFLRPGAIGAICPSSRFLARRMAREAAHCKDGLIIELGPGTGVVTQALLERGVAPERLLVVEYSMSFVQHLRKRFPQIAVIHGNASDLCQLVPVGAKISAIVSSLPLCSLPDPVMRSILNQWQILLQDGGMAVQFTYNLGQPHWRGHIQARHAGSTVVWANMPPARVSTFLFDTIRLISTHHEHHHA